MHLILLVVTLLVGLSIFPLLFYFQRLLKLPVPDLTRKSFHLHHSFYGACFIVFGLIAIWFSPLIELGIICMGLGGGFIMHHELTEPGLKGIGKFIFISPKK